MKPSPAKREQLWEHVLESAQQPGFFERSNHLFSRRAMLSRGFNGIGALGLAAALGPQTSAADNPLATRQSHFPARARRVIHLWMNGAPRRSTPLIQSHRC